MPLPKALQNKPTLQLGMELYFDAFWELSSCRPSGFGHGPIPWTAVLDYAQAFEFDGEQTDSLIYYIRMMDQEYLNHHAPKKGKGGKGKWQDQTP